MENVTKHRQREIGEKGNKAPLIASSPRKFMQAFAAWKRGSKSAQISVRNPNPDKDKPYVRITMHEYLGHEPPEDVSHTKNLRTQPPPAKRTILKDGRSELGALVASIDGLA